MNSMDRAGGLLLPHRTKGEKKDRKWHCFFLLFYVVAVVAVPFTPLGSKGSALNIVAKSVILLVFLLHFFFARKTSAKFNLTGLIICFLYGIGQVFSVLFSGQFAILINSASVLCMLAVCFLFIPRIECSAAEIQSVLKVFVLFIVFACGYNIVIHFDRIISFSFLKTIYYDMYSFFDNKNTYGIFLFAGLAANAYLLTYDHRTRYKISLAVILFSIILCMSRTSLFSSAIFLLLAYGLVATKKANKIFTVLLFLGIVILALCSVESFQNYVLRILVRSDVGSYREPIHDAAMGLFSQNPIFGYGEGAYGQFLQQMSDNQYVHSGYYNILLTGGIFYAVAYLLLFVKSITAAWQVRKQNLLLGSFMVAFLLAVLVYSFSESLALGGTSAANYAVTLFAVILPLLVHANLQRQNGGKLAAANEAA